MVNISPLDLASLLNCMVHSDSLPFFFNNNSLKELQVVINYKCAENGFIAATVPNLSVNIY